MKNTYRLLLRYICRNDYDEVSVILKEKDLDVLYDSGTFFNVSIESDSYGIVKYLLKYFEKEQLSTYKEGSDGYHILKNKMRDILRTAVEDIELSTEMKQVLFPYLNFEDSDSDIANLSDVSVESLDIKEKSTPSENLLTEENLRIFNQEFTSQDAHEESKLTGDLQESDIT